MHKWKTMYRNWQWSVYRKYSSTLKVGYHIYRSQREVKLKAVLKVELVLAPLLSTGLLGELSLRLTKLLSVDKDFDYLTGI